MLEDRIPVGFDVSKKTIEVCMLAPDGQKHKTKIANSNIGFRQLLSWLHGVDLSRVHACLEPTGRYSRPLAYFLHALGVRISQVNSFAVQNHGRSKKFRSKTDRIDAFLLADYCLKENPPHWEPASKVQLELSDLQHRLDCLDEAILQEKNRLEAGVDSKLVREDIEENLVRLQLRHQKLEQATRELIAADVRLEANIKILNSIIGIGEKSAIRLLAMIQFENFKNGRQVACYAGLSPRLYESGASIHKRTRVSKMGNRELRSCLYFPAMVAMQHNPHMRAFADKLRQKNKPSKVIVCAVMRKLLVLASALVRKQEMYDAEHSAILAST